MTISLRTAFLPILATALVCQPQMAPEAFHACLQTTMHVRVITQVLSREAMRLPGAIRELLSITRKPRR